MRAVGTRHSFNDLADTTGTLISVSGIDPDPVLNPGARTVTIGAGATYGALASWLEERGWALGNLASLPHITVGGAIATGTHGSGVGNQVLAAAVAGLQYVDAAGVVREARRGDTDFFGMPVGLGAFGIVTRVTLDVEPSYLIRQDVYAGLPWGRVLANLEDIMSAAYSVSLLTSWLGDSVEHAWVKRRITGPEDAVAAQFFGARLATGPVGLAGAPASHLTPLGVAGPWPQRLPHFRADAVPANGNEIQTEFFVPMSQGAAALEAVRGLRKRLARVLLVSEIRAIAADDLWLSGASGARRWPCTSPGATTLARSWACSPGSRRPSRPSVPARTGGQSGGGSAWTPCIPGSPTRETCSSASTPTAHSVTITCSASGSARPASHDARAGKCRGSPRDFVGVQAASVRTL